MMTTIGTLSGGSRLGETRPVARVRAAGSNRLGGLLLIGP
jgi:hypothetical protein